MHQMNVKPTLKQIVNAVKMARDYCDYYEQSNQTIGPYRVDDLTGSSTSRFYDHRREWDTEIAVALAEKEFDCDLRNHDIVNKGPWRDTVRSIHAAIHAEVAAEAAFERECEDGK